GAKTAFYRLAISDEPGWISRFQLQADDWDIGCQGKSNLLISPRAIEEVVGYKGQHDIHRLKRLLDLALPVLIRFDRVVSNERAYSELDQSVRQRMRLLLHSVSVTYEEPYRVRP